MVTARDDPCAWFCCGVGHMRGKTAYLLQAMALRGKCFLLRYARTTSHYSLTGKRELRAQAVDQGPRWAGDAAAEPSRRYFGCSLRQCDRHPGDTSDRSYDCLAASALPRHSQCGLSRAGAAR